MPGLDGGRESWDKSRRARARRPAAQGYGRSNLRIFRVSFPLRAAGTFTYRAELKT